MISWSALKALSPVIPAKFTGCVLLTVLLAPVQTVAQAVTFLLNGTVTHSSSASFVIGNPVVWTVTMDLSAPIVSSSGTSANGWASYDAVTAISVDVNNGEYVGTHSFLTPLNVLVQNHSTGDIFSINWFGPAVLTAWPLVEGKQVLLSPQFLVYSTGAGNALSSWDLVSPVGGDWFDTGADQTDVFHLLFSGGGFVDGNILSHSAVPEPSTYAALAGLGALGIAFWRRRQARLAS